MKLYHFIFVTFLLFALPKLVFAAPDPEELKILKEESPLHITGEVLKDEVVNVHKRENHNTQTRMMTLKIDKVIHQKSNLFYEPNQVIMITYHYLPTWVDYTGGGSIQVMKGDEIKLWLQLEDGKLTPLLGIHGVEMINQNGQRTEHVKQPFLQKAKATWISLWDTYLPYTVPIFILLLLVVISWAGIKSRNEKTYKH